MQVKMLFKEQKIKKKANEKFKKFWIVFVCLLVLYIPLSTAQDIISDRNTYRAQAKDAIERAWADKLRITAPEIKFKNQDTTAELEDYNVDIKLNTEIRKKGIFKIPVFTADVVQSGTFKVKNLTNDSKPTFVYDSGKKRGYIENPKINISNSKNFTELLGDSVNIDQLVKEQTPFVIKTKVRGMESVVVEPAGQKVKLKIAGNWKDPSFIGEFLPVEKNITKNDFSAVWSVPVSAYSATPLPSFGVELFTSLDSHNLAQKAIDHGFLFISLAFMCLYIFEVAAKVRIHPVQYLLTGFLMCMFYLLLLSIAEFMPFGVSYLIAAILITTILSVYTYNVIAKEKVFFSALMTFILAFLYLFLFVTLRLQDFSLITGTLGTIIIAVVAMYATRNVKWYGDSSSDDEKQIADNEAI